MGEIVIYQKDGFIELNAPFPKTVVTKSVLKRDLTTTDEVNIIFESNLPIDLYVDDYIIFEGRIYRLNFAPKFAKNSNSSYNYDLTFEGVSSQLKKKIYFNFDGLNQTTPEFPLTGQIETFLACLINNANLINGFTFRLGVFPQNTDVKTISFSNENCYDALQQICEEYSTEYEITETNGNATINIKQRGSVTPLTFEYGKGDGLYLLKRDNINPQNIITKLYAYGSTENIPSNYRNYSQRLKLPGSEFLQDNDKVKAMGLIEGVKIYDDIKPTFTAIIGTVNTLANSQQSFVITNIDFDLNAKDGNGNTLYLIAGTPAKIHVNKGNLAGYEFEVTKYDHVTKTLTIKQFADDRGQKFPDPETIFTFATGDEFVFLDIVMPPSYIIAAENKLLEAAKLDYEKFSQNNVQYTLDIDPMYFKNLGEETDVFLNIGDTITVKDFPLNINLSSRITSLTRDLINPYQYTVEIADGYEKNLMKQILSSIKNTASSIKTLTHQSTNNTTNINNTIGSFSFTYSQTSPRMEWIIPHNMKKYPSVTVMDISKTIIVGEVIYLNVNTVKIIFSKPIAGKAYLN